MTELEALARECIENHTHKLIARPTKQDIYTREESIYISGYKECERQNKNRIAELEEQNDNLITMLKAERDVRVNDDYLKGICEKEAEIDKLKKHHAACRDISENKIENLKDDVRALRKQIAKMRNCENCQTVRDANGNCYLHKDGKCDPKTKIKWEVKKC